jgi:Arc/MetJ-type ribon-helix-helix transcriptional regulator
MNIGVVAFRNLYILQLYYNCIMTMSVLQVRLPDGVVNAVDTMVGSGLYASRSDVIRDAIRKLILSKQIGSVPNVGESVKQTRDVRRKLSNSIKKFEDVDRINKLYK